MDRLESSLDRPWTMVGRFPDHEMEKAEPRLRAFR